jgi:probable H4MPT-linked C1 transfer pathway protein
MTAELSDVFRAKREGVGFVLDAVEAVSRVPVRVFTTAGEFVDGATARARPIDAAASNWVATAVLVGRFVPDAILVDIGSTTTDVIPVVSGRVTAVGRTDPERLLAGELVYTGALRTNVAAIVRRVPLRGGECPVASELFAISGDVHVLLGSIESADYTCPTPDGRPPTSDFAAERLARVVCADGEMLDAEDIRAMATAIRDAQVDEIAAAIDRVARRLPRPAPVVVTGLGDFLARQAAERVGLPVQDLARVLSVDVGTVAPAVAVAWLLTPDWVVKVGGSFGARPAQLRRLMETLAGAARRHWLVVVPGGGPFADEVRRVDRRFRLSDSAAHWMAILAMDQYGYLLQQLAPGSALVRHRRELTPGRLNVLAPSAWLLRADPLPHSWEVTSDSIAAWIARALRVRRVMLVKHTDGHVAPDLATRERRAAIAALGDVVDPYFARALGPAIACWIVRGQRPRRIARLIESAR